MAIGPRLHHVALTAEFHARHVAEQHARAVRPDAQEDVVEFRQCAQGGLSAERDVELLAGNGGQTAQLADGDITVLRRDGRGHIARGQAKAIELVGVEPHAHGVFRAEHAGLAHAGNASERIQNAG